MTYIRTYSNDSINFTGHLSSYLCTQITGSYNRVIGVGNGSKKFDCEVFGPNVDNSVIQTGLVEYKYVCDSLY